jgi:hypothetical protein
MSRLITLEVGIWSSARFFVVNTPLVLEPYFQDSDLYYRLHPYTKQTIEELYRVSSKNSRKPDG